MYKNVFSNDAKQRSGCQTKTTQVRVLLVGPLPPPPLLGGVETGVALLLNSRLGAATKMQLFNTARNENPERSIREKLVYQLTACRRFIQTLLSTKPDIVHVKTSSGINFYQNALYVLFARIFRKRVLLQIHSGGFPAFYDSASRIERTAIRAALRLPHRLLALSDNWAQYFRKIVGADHVVVVCNALPTKEYLLATPDRSRFRIPPKRATLLFIGTRSRSLDIAKGIHELIQAVALVRERHPELTLIMAGKISHETELRSVLGPPGDGWISIGVVTADVKPTLYRSVDLFALPSHYENMPNTLLEAMAAGLPVVATPVGAIPEVVQDQENGFLVPVGDMTTLAERIERLVSDERLRKSMGQIARDTVVEKFDFSVLERQLSCEYNVCVN